MTGGKTIDASHKMISPLCEIYLQLEFGNAQIDAHIQNSNLVIQQLLLLRVFYSYFAIFSIKLANYIIKEIVDY